MSTELSEHLELCAALAAGNLNPGDRKRFAEHLAEGCEECERTLPDFERATVLLAAALPLSAPGAGVRQRVLDAAANATPAPSVVLPFPVAARHRGRKVSLPAFQIPSWMLAAACGVAVLAALVSAAVAWHFAGEARRMHAEIASGTQIIEALNQQLEAEKGWGVLFTSADSRTASLNSTARSETVLRARAAYEPRSQRAMFVFNDLRAPEGKVYELWSIEGLKLSSLGVIKVDEIGHAVVRVEHAGDANRLTDFGVSLEAKGGSTSAAGPSGPLVMMGKVEG